MNSGVYSIRSDVTGDRYVGASMNLASRKVKHFQLLGQRAHYNAKLQAAYDAGGPTSMHFEVLEECDDRDDIRNREREWQQRLRPSCNPPAPDPPESPARPPTDLRQVVRDELKRRGWTVYRLVKELGGRVPPVTVYEFLREETEKGKPRDINSQALGFIFDVFGWELPPPAKRKGHK